MKTILRTAGAIVAAGMALAACGSAAHASTKSSSKKASTASTASYGWINSKTDAATGLPELMLPHAGLASPTIDKFATKDYSFYKEIINPADWVKSKTFGQYIFVGPYTKGVNYQRVRDAKIGAVDSVERGRLLAAGATTWPNKIGNFNSTSFDQVALGNIPSLIAAERYDAGDPIKAFTLNMPSIATIAESPVGMLTPKMMSNTPSQPQYSVPGTCIPHIFMVYYKGTVNPAISGGDYGSQAVYWIKYGPTNKLFSPNYNNSSVYNDTTSCKSMP